MEPIAVRVLAKLSRSMREDLGVSNLPHGFFNELPADVVQCIAVRMTLDPMTLVHHIGRAAPTCKVVSVAARNALSNDDLWKIACGHIGLTKFAIYTGAPTTWRDTFHQLCHELNIVRQTGVDMDTFEYFASIDGNLAQYPRLAYHLTAGADVKEMFMWTSMMEAIENDRLEIVQALLRAGVNPEIRDVGDEGSFLPAHRAYGYQEPLQWARRKNPEIAQVLRDAGATERNWW